MEGREGESPTREELYELVWSMPMRTAARQFGVSDVGLAKACHRAEIPVPPRGYWAKKRAGADVEQPPLPTVESTWENRVAVRWPFLPEDNVQDEHDDVDPEPEFPRDLKQRRQHFREMVGTVPVQSSEKPLHPAAVLSKERYATSEPARRGYWQPSVSADAPDERRLILASTVLNALERAGFLPTLREGQAFDFQVTVDGHAVYFALDQQQAYVGGLSREQAEAMMAFKLRDSTGEGSSKTIWNERKMPLEEQLTEVVVGILVAGEENRREMLRREHRRRWLEREVAAQRARQREEAEERAAIKKLEADAAAFRLASDIRALVTAARLSTKPGRAFDAWAGWAESHAERIDPVTNGTVSDPPTSDPYDRFSW